MNTLKLESSLKIAKISKNIYKYILKNYRIMKRNVRRPIKKISFKNIQIRLYQDNFKLFLIRHPHKYLEIIYFYIPPSLTIFTYEETFDFDCSTFLKNVTMVMQNRRYEKNQDWVRFEVFCLVCNSYIYVLISHM